MAGWLGLPYRWTRLNHEQQETNHEVRPKHQRLVRIYFGPGRLPVPDREAS